MLRNVASPCLPCLLQTVLCWDPTIYAMDAPTSGYARSRGERVIREILPDPYVRSVSHFRCK